MGDVEGDTRADLIVFKPKAPGQERGNVLVASSSGNDFGGIRYGHGYFCIDIEICRMGDFNGDGKIDVLLVKKPNPIGDEREIFVSLSNGSTFTNTQPFLWKTFSTSASINVHIADANGDRRDDVIFTQSAGTLTTYFVMDVVDHSGGGSSGASPPSAATGFGSVLAYNCTPEQYRVYYWVFDWTSGGLYSIGPADAMYSETGSCPDPADDSAVEVELKADHIHEIRVVVPDAIGCEGQNDPQIGACVRYSRSFVGQSNGGVFHWAVPE